MVLGCLHCSVSRTKVPVPSNMFPSSFKSYGPGRRKDSAIRTLVAETLVLAKTHGCVEKIESELEEELRRESKGDGSDPLSKWRRKGDKALRSKYVLLTVALFCVTDCALVLGELILDLHKVKDTLETSQRTIHKFKLTLHETYPSHITDADTDIREVFDMISRSRIIWNESAHHGANSSDLANSSSVSLPSSASSSSSSSSPCLDNSVSIGGSGKGSGSSSSSSSSLSSSSSSPSSSSSSSSTPGTVITVRRRKRRRGRRSSGGDAQDQQETEYIVVYEAGPTTGDKEAHNDSGSALRSHGGGEGAGHHGEGQHSLEEEIAHALHLTSITLMAILVFETVLKAFCAGLPFFKRKLETFDFFIVIVSFVADIVFMQILPRFKIQDFVFILAFLLPWRVIRVVNSLVVAVQDHEHFRLKLLYSRKKKIQNSLRETEVKLQLFRAQCCALKRLCLNEGVEENKIEQIVQLDEYVVNKTGKSKCKVRIDNASVILLDKCDFPRLSPRPSLASLLEKRRSIQVDSAGAREPSSKSDRFFKRNGHTLTVDDALRRDLKKAGKGKGGGGGGGFGAVVSGVRKSSFSFSFSNGPLSGLFGNKDLDTVPEAALVRRAGSQGQIADTSRQDLGLLSSAASAGGRVGGGGGIGIGGGGGGGGLSQSQSQLCHITVTSDACEASQPSTRKGVATSSAPTSPMEDPAGLGPSSSSFLPLHFHPAPSSSSSSTSAFPFPPTSSAPAALAIPGLTCDNRDCVRSCGSSSSASPSATTTVDVDVDVAAAAAAAAAAASSVVVVNDIDDDGDDVIIGGGRFGLGRDGDGDGGGGGDCECGEAVVGDYDNDDDSVAVTTTPPATDTTSVSTTATTADADNVVLASADQDSVYDIDELAGSRNALTPYRRLSSGGSAGGPYATAAGGDPPTLAPSGQGKATQRRWSDAGRSDPSFPHSNNCDTASPLAVNQSTSRSTSQSLGDDYPASSQLSTGRFVTPTSVDSVMPEGVRSPASVDSVRMPANVELGGNMPVGPVAGIESQGRTALPTMSGTTRNDRCSIQENTCESGTGRRDVARETVQVKSGSRLLGAHVLGHDEPVSESVASRKVDVVVADASSVKAERGNETLAERTTAKIPNGNLRHASSASNPYVEVANVGNSTQGSIPKPACPPFDETSVKRDTKDDVKHMAIPVSMKGPCGEIPGAMTSLPPLQERDNQSDHGATSVATASTLNAGLLSTMVGAQGVDCNSRKRANVDEQVNEPSADNAKEDTTGRSVPIPPLNLVEDKAEPIRAMPVVRDKDHPSANHS